MILQRFLRSTTFRQFIKFGMIGVMGFIVDFVMLTVGIEILHLGRYAAAFFSFPFAITATWLGNRHFTFRGQSRHSAREEFLRFVSVCALGLVINRGTYSLVITLVPIAYTHPILGLIAGTGTGMFFNFFLSKKLVFR